jgi:DivIVA domain-containing protein
VAISFSRPDPSSPASVRDANFPTSRRGFDQSEVREFLRMVAAELARMQERERYLDQELRSMRLHRPGPPPELDDETLARLLGEETTRILQAARESAAAMRNKAEEAADRMLREAREDAQHLRDETDSEVARRRRDAEQDAEAELEMAKQQGREMVEEARAYRERVLSELSRRRDLARQQIDQLVHGRDRLVQAFERARLVAADVVAELAPLGELSEYVNLSPTTGPVPVMVPASRLGEMSSISDDVLAARAADDPDDPALDPNGSDETKAIDSRLAGTSADATDAAGSSADDSGAKVKDAKGDEVKDAEVKGAEEPPAEAAPAPGAGATVLQFPDRRADTVVIAPGSEAEADDEVDGDEVDGEAVDGEATEPGAGAEEDGHPTVASVDEDEVDDDDITANDVDNLFARLRSESAETEPAAGPTDAALDAPAAPTPFEVRDEALTPLIVSSGRKLKRVLADEQNDVLDKLRGKKAVRAIDDVLPAADEQSGRYFDALAGDVRAAAAAGARSIGTAGDAASPGDDAVAPVQEALAGDLVGPMRERLAAGIEAVDGDKEELTKKIRAIYREWKTRRIDDLLDDLLRHAYSRGAFAAFRDGQLVRWIFDPAVGACSDCEDNSLQQSVAAGTAFPTGHTCAPAHSGCRCLVLPAD